MKKRDKIITTIIIVIALVFFGYRYVLEDEDDVVVQVGDEVVLREISAENFYQVPGKIRQVRYNLFLNADGAIEKVTADDINDTVAHQGKMDEFAAELIKEVQGQKLSELKEFDMIGTSSLTTKSFNAALPELQIQVQ